MDMILPFIAHGKGNNQHGNGSTTAIRLLWGKKNTQQQPQEPQLQAWPHNSNAKGRQSIPGLRIL